MKYFEEIPHVVSLVESIRIASLDAGAQLRWVRNARVYEEEIAL